MEPRITIKGPGERYLQKARQVLEAHKSRMQALGRAVDSLRMQLGPDAWLDIRSTTLGDFVTITAGAGDTAPTAMEMIYHYVFNTNPLKAPGAVQVTRDGHKLRVKQLLGADTVLAPAQTNSREDATDFANEWQPTTANNFVPGFCVWYDKAHDPVWQVQMLIAKQDGWTYNALRIVGYQRVLASLYGYVHGACVAQVPLPPGADTGVEVYPVAMVAWWVFDPAKPGITLAVEEIAGTRPVVQFFVPLNLPLIANQKGYQAGPLTFNRAANRCTGVYSVKDTESVDGSAIRWHSAVVELNIHMDRDKEGTLLLQAALTRPAVFEAEKPATATGVEHYFPSAGPGSVNSNPRIYLEVDQTITRKTYTLSGYRHEDDALDWVELESSLTLKESGSDTTTIGARTHYADDCVLHSTAPKEYAYSSTYQTVANIHITRTTNDHETLTYRNARGEVLATGSTTWTTTTEGIGTETRYQDASAIGPACERLPPPDEQAFRLDYPALTRMPYYHTTAKREGWPSLTFDPASGNWFAWRETLDSTAERNPAPPYDDPDSYTIKRTETRTVHYDSNFGFARAAGESTIPSGQTPIPYGFGNFYGLGPHLTRDITVPTRRFPTTVAPQGQGVQGHAIWHAHPSGIQAFYFAWEDDFGLPVRFDRIVWPDKAKTSTTHAAILNDLIKKGLLPADSINTIGNSRYAVGLFIPERIPVRNP